MTFKTSGAFELITIDAIVLIRQIIPVVVLMAVDTTEQGKIPGGSMAFYTIVPLVAVIAAVNWKIHSVVIKISWFPCFFRMALQTIGGKVSCPVIRIVCFVVIVFVTTDARCRCIRESSIMAGRTIVGNAGVCAL